MPRKRRPIPWLKVRDETYYVFWTDEKGQTQRLSLRTTDAVEAQQSYARFLATGSLFTSGVAGLTVAGALDDYLREHVEVNVVDRQRQKYAIKHLKTFFADRLVKDIDIPMSREYAGARRIGVVGDEATDSTIRREIGVLQAAANHALRWKRILRNDMPSIERPRETARKASWLTRAELARVVHDASEPLRAFILVAYYTAGRRESVARLRKCQIDLQHGRIDLRAPDETKLQRGSKKRRPTVPIDPKLRPVIEKLMIESKDEWLFDVVTFYRPFTKLMKSLGFDASPHVLRHSRATHLLQDGVSIYSVARLLGDTVATVDRVYGHHSTEHLAEAIKERSTAS